VEQQQTWRFDDFDNGPDEGIDKRFFIRVACPFMISTSGEGMQKEVSHFISSPSQYTVRGVRVFTPSDSDCPVSIVAPLNLVASATLALKAVVSSEKFGASVFGISRSTQHTHVRGVRAFTPLDSDCPVSIVAPLHLVASATLALKAVVSSEDFGESVFGISRSTQHTHAHVHAPEIVITFTSLDCSGCPFICLHLSFVASATLAAVTVVSSEDIDARVLNISHTQLHAHIHAPVRGFRYLFASWFSDFSVSILASLLLVASATLAVKAVVSSEGFGTLISGSCSTQHVHIRLLAFTSILSGVLLAFTSILSGCLVSMLAPFHLVASATLAAKAVVSSEGFGVGYGWVVSDSQAGALRLPRLRARTFLFVASATLAAKAGVGQAH
jgi:hypothetical protein